MFLVKSFMELEKLVGFKQGKGGNWKTCLKLLPDIKEDDIDDKLSTVDEEHPKLMVLTSNREIEMIKICGDGTVMHVSELSLPYAVITLCMSYYTYDIQYPRKYCMTLATFQHLVLKDPYLESRSTGFVNFVSKYEKFSKRKM